MKNFLILMENSINKSKKLLNNLPNETNNKTINPKKKIRFRNKKFIFKKEL